ncbi:hypothetical protein QAD02_022577 [Eretmocerus hayati]|uniref:Uncharacterized protein n=1 Tax=Eretmocerus hayati TaxID=131215 RepID=A0ACC2PTI1_9HYME|nr:hypothetical protein QAD02_022577 [Eretmocerus hayati]
MFTIYNYLAKNKIPDKEVSGENNRIPDARHQQIFRKDSLQNDQDESRFMKENISINNNVQATDVTPIKTTKDDGYDSAHDNEKADRLEAQAIADSKSRKTEQNDGIHHNLNAKAHEQGPINANPRRNRATSREQHEEGMNEMTISGKVKIRKNRDIYLEDDTCFNLDRIAPHFIPNVGDYIKLDCVVLNSKIPGAKCKISRVKSIHPLEKLHRSGTVTEYNLLKQSGIIDGEIEFYRCNCIPGYSPCVGDTVIVDGLKSDQGNLEWRALQVSPSKNDATFKRSALSFKPVVAESELHELTQNKDNIEITYPTRIELAARGKTNIEITVKNNGNWRQIINLCTVFNDRHTNSQLNLMSPSTVEPQHVKPSNEIRYDFQVNAKYVGVSREIVVFKFEKFQLGRVVEVEVKSIDFAPESSDCEAPVENPYDSLKNTEKNLCIRGVLPFKTPNFVRNRSVNCRVPDEIEAIINKIELENQSWKEAHWTLREKIPYLQTPLNFDNYLHRFTCLLYLEEVGHCKQMKKFNMANAILQRKGEYLTLYVPGLLEKQPPLIGGDRIIVSLRDSSKEVRQYEGFIHKIDDSDVLLKFDPKLHQDYAGEPCFVEFRLSRTIYKRCHSAIEIATSRLGRSVLFPQKVHQKSVQCDLDDDSDRAASASSDSDDTNTSKICAIKAGMKKKKICWFNERLNHYQKEAVKNILKGVVRPMPYVIFGPPGTGKTMTACEAVLQIFFSVPKSRILVVTPSNNSANLIAERLLKSDELVTEDIVRLVAKSYLDSGSVPEMLRTYCVTADIAEERTRSDVNLTDSRGYRTNLTLSVLMKHRIIVATCSAAGIIHNMGAKAGDFTHILVDEAGQATEPEVMISLSLGHSDKTQIVLVGDPKQLGPNNKSPYAAHFGLDQSFLARLLKLFPYQRDPQGFETGYDPRVVTKLLENYRSLPDLLSLPNQLFYDNELIPKVHIAESEEAEILENLTDMLPKRLGSPLPIVFHCVYGKSLVDPNTTSWYNLDEATQVYIYLMDLYDHGLMPDDIGIIAPYMKQVHKIRGCISKSGAAMPKVGSVEDFQGQERKVIILSTVRTPEQDAKSALGFVASSERLNVAITRARALLMIVGHPDILSRNYAWKSVLEYCSVRDSMIAQHPEDS